MEPTARRPRAPLAARLGAVAARLARAVAEAHRAQRQLLFLRLHPDRYAPDGDAAPATYGEFLFRCPQAIWHEPPGGERGGRAPRRPWDG